MVEQLRPEVMIRQVETLADDLRLMTGPIAGRIAGLLAPAEWAAIDRAYLVGDGDSHHASCAASLAFETISGVACRPVSALPFSEYTAPSMPNVGQGRCLVIAVSASGGTDRVVQAIETANVHSAVTVAITGSPGSPVTQVADRTLTVELANLEPSPGIRTYQASLLALLLIAIYARETRGHQRQPLPDTLRREIIEVADGIEATTRTIKDRCREAAGLVADAPVVMMTGSGPNYGTALFSAAKMIEAAGVFAMGQDLEEWRHVERHAYPDDMPTVVIAPPGHSYPHAAMVAAQARDLGRRVVAVTVEGDTDIAGQAHVVLPVCAEMREEFTPLLYHLFSNYLAAFVAERLARLPFQADRFRSVGGG